MNLCAADALRQHAKAVLAAGGRHMTITTPAAWRRPKGFPRCELLSINPTTGERNLRLLAHRLVEFLDLTPQKEQP